MIKIITGKIYVVVLCAELANILKKRSLQRWSGSYS